MKEITEQTGARIRVDESRPLEFGALEQKLNMSGTVEQIERAKTIVAEKINRWQQV